MADKSVNEILLSEGNPEVAYHTDAFYSHTRKLDIASSINTLNRVSQEYSGELKTLCPRFWVDYFALRQCQDDFNLNEILKVLQYINCTVVEIPTNPSDYFT